MDDIKRQDLKVFLREFFSLTRLIIVLVALVVVGAICQATMPGVGGFVRALPIWFIIIGSSAFTAYNSSLSKRFINRRYDSLWKGCQDRLLRFNEVLKRLRKEQVADLREMPATIQRIADTLYIALRKADIISSEVFKTERNVPPAVWNAAATDPQSKELYRIADKNHAEYQQEFAGVMAGVERAEAQSAVFMTTLDTLRIKMLGYRLIGKSPEMPSQDFLVALHEAKLQLQAIDNALEYVRNHPELAVPEHLKNYPKPNHPEKYQYPHDFPGHFISQNYLPKEISNKRFFEATEIGKEKFLKERLMSLWDKFKN